jgi:excisionase family DNA binding protein
MSEVARDPLAELARLLPTVLDESALHELAVRLQPLLRAGEALDSGKRLYTAAEAAELVGVNIETVPRAIRSGRLGVAGRIGRSPRISRDAIDRWLTSTIELTDNGPRHRPRQLLSLTRSLPTAEDMRSPRAPRSLWSLARRTLREVAEIAAIGSFAKRAQRVGFAGFGGNGPRCRRRV